jgi:hypothetical protein
VASDSGHVGIEVVFGSVKACVIDFLLAIFFLIFRKPFLMELSHELCE